MAQLVRRQSKQSDLLSSRIEEPRPEVRIAQHPAPWSGKHQLAGGLPGQVVRQLVGQEAGDRRLAGKGIGVRALVWGAQRCAAMSSARCSGVRAAAVTASPIMVCSGVAGL